MYTTFVLTSLVTYQSFLLDSIDVGTRVDILYTDQQKDI